MSKGTNVRIEKGRMVVEFPLPTRYLDRFFKLRCAGDLLNAKGFRTDSNRTTQLYAAYDLLYQSFPALLKSSTCTLFTNNHSMYLFFQHMTKWNVNKGVPSAAHTGANVFYVTLNHNIRRRGQKQIVLPNCNLIHVSPTMDSATSKSLEPLCYEDQGIFGANKTIVASLLR